MAVVPPSLPADAPRVADGRYVLISRLGQGGMTVVYGAWDEDLRIWRAVKVLLPALARQASVRRRFEVEAQTMMTIRHPNLVRVIEVHTERALPYLVMDLVPGGSIEDWTVRNGPMPARLAADVGIQISRGLSAVHETGAVYRGLNPQNVLADRDGTCKLTDFALAQVEDENTRTGVATRPVGYKSPEQLADSTSVDSRTDIYSLGATLYALLTRSPTHDLIRVADDWSRLDRIPDPLRPIVATCLHHDPQDRYADVDLLQAALDSVFEELPSMPQGTPTLPRRQSDPNLGTSPGTFPELEGMFEAEYTPVDLSEWAVPPEAPMPIFAMDTEVRRPQSRPPAYPTTRRPIPLPHERRDLTVPVMIDSTRLPPATTVEPTMPLPPSPSPSPSSSSSSSLPLPLPTPRSRRWLGLVAGGILIGGGVLLAVGLVGGLPMVRASATRLDAAATAYAAAEEVVTSRVGDVTLTLQDLSLVGGVTVSAEGGPVAVAERLAMPVRPFLAVRADNPDRELARQRLQRVVWSLDQLHRARHDWESAAASPTAWIAIRAGLASPPRPVTP